MNDTPPRPTRPLCACGGPAVARVADLALCTECLALATFWGLVVPLPTDDREPLCL
jgi:hypothetical protein